MAIYRMAQVVTHSAQHGALVSWTRPMGMCATDERVQGTALPLGVQNWLPEVSISDSSADSLQAWEMLSPGRITWDGDAVDKYLD